jgi:hypothetical protein
MGVSHRDLSKRRTSGKSANQQVFKANAVPKLRHLPSVGKAGAIPADVGSRSPLESACDQIGGIANGKDAWSSMDLVAR